jgi:hypothetical protein
MLSANRSPWGGDTAPRARHPVPSSASSSSSSLSARTGSSRLTFASASSGLTAAAAAEQEEHEQREEGEEEDDEEELDGYDGDAPSTAAKRRRQTATSRTLPHATSDGDITSAPPTIVPNTPAARAIAAHASAGTMGKPKKKRLGKAIKKRLGMRDVKRKRRRHKQVKGKLIDGEHEQFAIAFAMSHGIHYSVLKAEEDASGRGDSHVLLDFSASLKPLSAELLEFLAPVRSLRGRSGGEGTGGEDAEDEQKEGGGRTSNSAGIARQVGAATIVSPQVGGEHGRAALELSDINATPLPSMGRVRSEPSHPSHLNVSARVAATPPRAPKLAAGASDSALLSRDGGASRGIPASVELAWVGKGSASKEGKGAVARMVRKDLKSLAQDLLNLPQMPMRARVPNALFERVDEVTFGKGVWKEAEKQAGVQKGKGSSSGFGFVDFAPQVFARIRAHFGVSQHSYLESLCSDLSFVEFISNSKSGQYFFYTKDGAFMVKTQTPSEEKFLQKILPLYYAHVMAQPGTFLTRFFGMHQVKMAHLGRTVRFVVMASVFDTEEEIHVRYDLKGSTHKRLSSEAEAVAGDPLKDLNLLRMGTAFHLGPVRRAAMLKQLRADVALLSTLQIMDYSLLVGTHFGAAQARASALQLGASGKVRRSSGSNLPGVEEGSRSGGILCCKKNKQAAAPRGKASSRKGPGVASGEPKRFNDAAVKPLNITQLLQHAGKHAAAHEEFIAPKPPPPAPAVVAQALEVAPGAMAIKGAGRPQTLRSDSARSLLSSGFSDDQGDDYYEEAWDELEGPWDDETLPMSRRLEEWEKARGPGLHGLTVREDCGVRSDRCDQESPELYFFGVIDILQVSSTRKPG